MKKFRKFNALLIAMMMLFISVGSVVQVDAASVKLNKKSVTIEKGKSVTLKVKGTKKKVTWKSSNKKIVSVSKKGKVKAKKKGSATITAKVGKKKLKCKVKVVAAKKKPSAESKPEPSSEVKPTPAVDALSEYWSPDSQAAKSLKEYVSKVTNENDKENFIPVKDRIAVFDMDGTLTCETYYTYYDTMMFIEYCLNDFPDNVSKNLKDEAQAIKPGYTAGEKLARDFAKAYEGMTVQELYDYAVEFGKKHTSSFNNMTYNGGFYLPMVELVKYLYDNDFTIYVVSGTERTTTRAIVDNSPIRDYVTSNHVIGTEFEVKLKGHEIESSNMNYNYDKGDELVFTGGFVQKNLNANKVIFIQKEIGKRPVLAFGNSGSDTSMMNYAIDNNKYPAQAYMVVADDSDREWGKAENWDKNVDKYKNKDYVMVSMKNDFAQIYPEGVTKADEQYVEKDWTQLSTQSVEQTYDDSEEALDDAA